MKSEKIRYWEKTSATRRLRFEQGRAWLRDSYRQFGAGEGTFGSRLRDSTFHRVFSRVAFGGAVRRELDIRRDQLPYAICGTSNLRVLESLFKVAALATPAEHFLTRAKNPESFAARIRSTQQLSMSPPRHPAQHPPGPFFRALPVAKLNLSVVLATSVDL